LVVDGRSRRMVPAGGGHRRVSHAADPALVTPSAGDAQGLLPIARAAQALTWSDDQKARR
jgi:hypothetical protein